MDGLTTPSPSVATSGGGFWNFADNAMSTALQGFLLREQIKAGQNAAGIDRISYTGTVEVPVNTAVVVDENKQTAQSQAASKNIEVFGVTMNRNLLIFSGVMLGLAVFVKKVL